MIAKASELRRPVSSVVPRASLTNLSKATSFQRVSFGTSTRRREKPSGHRARYGRLSKLRRFAFSLSPRAPRQETQHAQPQQGGDRPKPQHELAVA
jgi:hypothetical protein